MRSDKGGFVIIGGGVSGMAAGILLADQGHDVVLVEKKNRIASTLSGFVRQGARFDTGLHYAGGLHSKGVLSRYFRALDLEELPLADFNPRCFDRVRLIEAGLELELPIGREALAGALADAFPRDAGFIYAYFKKMWEAFHSSPFLNFSGDFQAHMTEAFSRESLDQVLRQGTDNPALYTALSIHSLLYGVAPEETSFLQHARVAGSYLEGVKSVVGGGKRLAQAFTSRLSRAGVRVECGAAASQLAFSDKKGVIGVRLEDERYIPAPGGVIFTAHPAFLPGLLPEGVVKPALVRRFPALEDTVSSYAMFCKSPEPVPLVQGSNLFVCPGTDISPGFRPDCIPEAGPFYVTGGTDDGAGEREKRPQSLLALAPGNIRECAPFADSRSGRRPPAYAAFKAERLHSIKEALLKHCPELAGMTLVDGATPLTNRDFLESPGCGLYGAKHSLRQFSPLPVTRIPNLWMAGQSVIAPGVLGALVSAFVACGFILGRETLHKKLADCA